MGDDEQEVRVFAAVRASFESVTPENTRRTSDPTRNYNCIAWALNDTSRWWWPEPEAAYWPERDVSDPSIDTFRRMFAARGFTAATREVAELRIDAVALYADEHGEATHAARCLGAGRWTSKLGDGIDVEHTLEALEGKLYGSAVAFFVPAS